MIIYEAFLLLFTCIVFYVIYGHDFYVSKVYHSMKLNEKPLTAWIIVQKDGIVRSTHCDCVAGLSETCSHISTLLYALANLHFMTSTYKVHP